jgi:N-acetylmuramoyl-L-alanine amidase
VPSANVVDAAVPVPSPHCASYSSRLAAAILGCALSLLIPLDKARAATIQRFLVRGIDHGAEVDFVVTGIAPSWHLHGHDQELWLELENARLNKPIETLSEPIFPISLVSVRDLGDERVRLIIRVRGRVDYVVARMPHALVVRIAPSGGAVDLARGLLTGMPPALGLLSRPTAPTSSEEPSHRAVRSPAINPTGLPGQSLMPMNPPVAVQSAISGPLHVRSANPPLSSPLVGIEPIDGQRSFPQTVPSASNHAAAGPWRGHDRARPLVAIDPGHGGFDPGTASAGGMDEKDVALAIARRLTTDLQARGVDAELTRSDDSFLSLGERTQVANRDRADLFVSVHLNSSPNWSTSGIETYYLNNTTDRATIRLAALENDGNYSRVSHSNLNYILTNLQQDYKAHESSSLARMIEVEAVASVEAAMGIRVNALGAKMGPFYVLVGAEMPSVLVECGFLSNQREARLLLQPTYQAALAEGIAMAIMHYFQADAEVGNL